MFITEQQLALYKYQSNSKYFGKLMSQIAIDEYFNFLESNQSWGYVIEHFSHFLHRKLKKDLWEFHFPDRSILIIRLYWEKNEKYPSFSTRSYELRVDYSDMP